MKKLFCLMLAFSIPFLSRAASVTVNKSGAGDFTSIQAAIDSGATTITITDSGHYVENVEVGGQDTGGPAVTITSTQTGANRPVVTPAEARLYTDSTRVNQAAGFAVFANNSVISNLIVEAQPDLPAGAMLVMANNVTIDKCLFRIAADTTATLASSNPLLFFGQEGDGSGNLVSGVNPLPGGRDSNGCLVRDSEFMGVAAGVTPLEPTPDSLGYLGQVSDGTGTGQLSGYIRMDHQTAGSSVTVTIEGCYFHHGRDYGIFPTNRRDGAGEINVVVKNSRFDAQGKFQVRGRGANIFVESCVFSRSNQIRNGDGENSAVALQINEGHIPHGRVENSLFVNCGSANAQQGYFGGINNNNASLIEVENCTFVRCLNGVNTGSGGTANMFVRNSIFHEIGLNTPPAVDATGVTLTAGHPDLVNGAYEAWLLGLPNFGANKWSGAFNRFRANESILTIQNCLVGMIDHEETRPWEEAFDSGEVLGSRLLAGPDESFAGLETIVRGVPIFSNSDVDAPNAFKLAPASPGQGLGADLASALGIKLLINRSGTTATISWKPPIWVNGYSLKSASTLTAPVWTAVAGVVDNSVTIPISTGNQFFALIKD